MSGKKKMYVLIKRKSDKQWQAVTPLKEKVTARELDLKLPKNIVSKYDYLIVNEKALLKKIVDQAPTGE